MSSDSAPIAPTANSLEHYAALLRALMPRISAISIFDIAGEIIWSSEVTQDGQLHAIVEQLLLTRGEHGNAPGMMLTLDSDEPIYAFWLRRDAATVDDAPFALVLLRNRRNEDVDPPTFSYVHSMAGPAIECLRRELLARDEIGSLQNSLSDHDQDMALLLAVSGGAPGSTAGAVDDPREILRRASEHLGAGLATLLIPDKGMAFVEKGASLPLDTSVLAKTHRFLMSIAQNSGAPVLKNSLTLSSASGEERCHLLACPLKGRGGGVLAFFRGLEQPPFAERQKRIAELLARGVSSMVASNYDALTGLLTRAAFERRLQAQLNANGLRTGTWSAMYVDVNRTHVINETHGMPVGDRVLASVGELLRKNTPPNGVAARISGDRFAVLLATDLTTAEAFAESVRSSAEQIAAAIGQPKLQTSLSIGLAPVEARAQNYAHAFAAAESACKAANDRGRNRTELFQPDDVSLVRRFNDIGLIGDVRSALHEGRLLLYAQPILALSVPQAPHAEVLLRMLDKSGQTMGPDHFMSAATRYQFMPDIDRWVISEVLKKLAPHTKELASTGAVFTINFSGQSLLDPAFPNHVAGLIERSGVRPTSLCFELTESTAVANVQRAEELMLRLRGLGCGIALDDFGTGMSSLAYLRTLPVSMLKIDGSFVRDVITDARACSMVQAITQLARGMNLVTVAECVETAEIRDRVAELGADYGQGFKLGAPMPMEQAIERLLGVRPANGESAGFAQAV